MHSGCLIRAASSNSPITAPEDGGPLGLLYFDLARLAVGARWHMDRPGMEFHLVPLSGKMDVTIGDQTFSGVGGRASVWDGTADSVYAGSGHAIEVVATEPLELAIAGGCTENSYEPFRVSPSDVVCVEVGSSETKSRRRLFHLLGQNGAGRAGNLLVSELHAEEGCWSGYPPHKHDTDRSEVSGDGSLQPIETDHEELYHYRYRPEDGFGAQFCYRDGEEPSVEMIRNRDTFLVPSGYHPTVTSPGHEEYIFTVLVGRTQRGLVQYFEKTHEHLLDSIPGIAEMKNAFK